MLADNLRDNRNRAAAIFVHFIALRHKHSSSLFCSFEGDDSKYYGSRIEDKLNYKPDEVHHFTCGGKKEVLRFYQMINKNDDYKDVKVMYFIDRDFDESIIEKFDNNIYETPCYSIENFYTTKDAFKRILKREFMFEEYDEEYNIILDLFIGRQRDFHKKTKLFNAWLSCQRECSNSGQKAILNLSNFNLKKIVTKINLDEVVADYDINKLHSLFTDAIRIEENVLKSKIAELEKFTPQMCFRGKFEIDFLYEFISELKKEMKKPTSSLKKKPGVQINISKKNVISELSHHADTTECLENYLLSFN